MDLASADNPEGPWKRCSELNPVDLGISFTENPIVTKLDNGLFVAVVDAGYDSTGLKRSAFGYFYSNDGIHWSKEQLCYIENKVPKWWNWMRTPLCLIKEDDGTYTVFHTAYKKNDYGSIGKLKVKITIDSIKPLIYAIAGLSANTGWRQLISVLYFTMAMVPTPVIFQERATCGFSGQTILSFVCIMMLPVREAGLLHWPPAKTLFTGKRKVLYFSWERKMNPIPEAPVMEPPILTGKNGICFTWEHPM